MDQNSDQLSIDTPELVAIQMPLAGIGSRFIALLVDYVMWLAVAIAGIGGFVASCSRASLPSHGFLRNGP